MTMSVVRGVVIAVAMMVALSAISFAAEPMFKGSEPIPADAVVLFDGKNLSAFNQCGSDKAATWTVKDGYCTPEGPDICSKQLFKDCQLHVEFWVPLMPDNKGQARGNSGVFFMGFTYELQILDSYELQPGVGDCGAIYSYTPPMVNACRPPETWQSFDIVFHAPKFDADGKKAANARVTVFQNNVLIHNNAEIPGPTIDRKTPDPKDAGPIRLQNHGYPVRFRNIWVRAL